MSNISFSHLLLSIVRFFLPTFNSIEMMVEKSLAFDPYGHAFHAALTLSLDIWLMKSMHLHMHLIPPTIYLLLLLFWTFSVRFACYWIYAESNEMPNKNGWPNVCVCAIMKNHIDGRINRIFMCSITILPWDIQIGWIDMILFCSIICEMKKNAKRKTQPVRNEPDVLCISFDFI